MERDVSRDRGAAEELVRRTGQMGVPVTAIAGDYIVGFDRRRLAQAVTRLRAASLKSATLGAAVKDAPDGRALVGVVHRDTPAARAGLQPGDVIVGMDGATVAGAEALAQLVAAQQRGRATMEVRRADRTLALQVQFSQAG